MNTASTKEEQRIEIVQDALKWIRSGHFRPKMGTIIDYPQLSLPTGNGGYLACDLQPVINEFLGTENKTCKVCARGALFLTTVAKYNDFSEKLSTIVSTTGTMQSSYRGDNTIDGRLMKIFDSYQIALIECAFEQGCNGSMLLSTDFQMARDFGYRHELDEDRLIAILLNMLQNNGIFKP